MDIIQEKIEEPTQVPADLCGELAILTFSGAKIPKAHRDRNEWRRFHNDVRRGRHLRRGIFRVAVIVPTAVVRVPGEQLLVQIKQLCPGYKVCGCPKKIYPIFSSPFPNSATVWVVVRVRE